MSDSIIQELRSIREQHAASMNYDLDRIFADLKINQEQHAIEGWVVIPSPSCPPLESKFALQRIRFSHLVDSTLKCTASEL